MGFLLSGGSRVNDGSPVATTLRVQSSVNGLPLGFVHGQNRLAGNLIWYGNFSSTSGSGKGGGKGGTISSGGKGGAGSGTTYSASFMLGLCEGPIDQIVRLWNNKTPQSLGSVGFTEFNGYQGQTPWGYLTSTYPGYALSYSYLAYTAVGNLGLGNSPELPNFNWEVRGSIANAVTEQTVIASPYSFTASYFSLCDSITEQVIIPAAPYQYQAQNYTASNAMPVILGEIASANIVGSISSGVVDLNGVPFTQVGTPTATHEYSVSSSGVYTFYSGDEGLEIQIIDLAIAPGVRYIYNSSGTATAGNTVLTGITPSAQIAAGQLCTGPGVAPGSVVITASGSTVTLSTPATSNGSGTYTFWGSRLTQVLGVSGTLPAVGTFTASAVFPNFGQLQVGWNNLPSGIQVGQNISGPAIPSGTTITKITIGLFETDWLIFLSQNATTTTSNQTYSFGGGPVIFSLAAGTYSLSVTGSAYGQYQLSSADNGKAIGIIDVVDADPTQSLADFLTNPRYGCGFPSQYLGNLSLLQEYAYSNGLFISPALVQAQAANSYLKDFSTALNGEFVWSSGLLTFVPYGDVASTGNGKSYSPPAAAIYSLGDDDFLKNEGTASVGVSAFTSDDPVVCARKRQSDAYNDVKVEYLDRGNSYNPSIVEAKDDAAINTFGLRPADTKQLHMFCIEAAALQSAQLQLGRQQIRNTYTFTVPWYYILLDPMDVVEINDANLGLVNQWVRILEITENQQDGTLTISAEEYLTGSGSTPQYGTQVKAGYTPNYNADPGLPVAPIVFEAPVQIATNSGLEIWLATGGGSNFGGCDVWVSTDDETYKWVSRYQSGSRVGQVASDFPSATDPDTTHTLAVNLSTAGELFSGSSQSDADLGHTLCYVGGYAYPPIPQLSYVAGGGLPATTYFVRQTYLYAGGEGPPSPETSIAVPAGNLLVIQAPPTQQNATSYNNYVGINSGTETLQNSSPLAFGSEWTEPSSGVINGASPPPSETGYELVSYENATFVSGSLYDLGTYIRRGQYGTTISDHPLGSQFARLDGTQVTFPYDKSQIGQTIYIKMLPFNLWGGAEYTLDEVQPFPHVIEGPPLPGTVTGFSVSQSNNVVAFYWTDLNDVALEGYDLLYGPIGGNVGSATYISNALHGTESTTASVPPGAWTFYIRGRDIAGQLGPVTTFNFTVTNQNTIVETQVNAPNWVGFYGGDNTIQWRRNHWGILIPESSVGASALTNTQLFTQFLPSPVPDSFWGSPLIDIGFNDTVRVWMSVQAAVRSDAPSGSAPQNSFAIVAWENGQPEPSTYSNFTTGYIECEYIYAGYNQNNTNVPAYVSGFNVNVDKATVTQTGTATISSGGTAITFPTQFHETPIVSCTVIGSTSLSATAASPGDTGFTAHVFNPATGADVGGNISWSATGV